jgi:flagellar basal-body rod modification protein FlgD
MSSLSSLLSTSANSASGASKQARDIKDLDLNQFLQLMITELTNQDPLNPLDNAELVQQIGNIRSIAATDQLSSTLASLQTGQSLATASNLLGKRITALSTGSQNVSGIVDRVSIEVDPDDNSKRTYRVHVGDQAIDLKNVREVN